VRRSRRLTVPVRSTVAVDAVTAACVTIVTGPGGPTGVVGVAGVAPEPDPDGEPGIGGGVKPGAMAPGEPGVDGGSGRRRRVQCLDGRNIIRRQLVGASVVRIHHSRRIVRMAQTESVPHFVQHNRKDIDIRAHLPVLIRVEVHVSRERFRIWRIGEKSMREHTPRTVEWVRIAMIAGGE